MPIRTDQTIRTDHTDRTTQFDPPDRSGRNRCRTTAPEDAS
ncbi:hypothetical protein ACIOHE_35470 [Streptomyces sp. NPDC087851]